MPEARILLDVSRLIWRQWTRRLPTGIDRVCLAYLDHFRSRSLAVVQFRGFRRILRRGDSDRLFDLLLEGSPNFRLKLTALLASAAARREAAADSALYLNIGHTGLDSPFLAPWLTQHSLKPVFLIHDLIPITHPQYCRDGEYARHTQRMTHALQCARGVIVNSRATEQHLGAFAADAGLDLPPCQVTWLGIDTPAATAGPAPARPYFVIVGTIEARKNHRLVLDVWTSLVERLGSEAPELVIVGQRGWEAEDVFAKLDHPGPLAGHVRELGRCDDAEMHGLIAGARAMLMPSFAEGYGLPLIEALQLGTPVIASGLPVFREIAGDIPEYRDPADASAWLDAVLAYSADGPERSGQLARLSTYRAPTWADHFRRVQAFLETL